MRLRKDVFDAIVCTAGIVSLLNFVVLVVVAINVSYDPPEPKLGSTCNHPFESFGCQHVYWDSVLYIMPSALVSNTSTIEQITKATSDYTMFENVCEHNVINGIVYQFPQLQYRTCIVYSSHVYASGVAGAVCILYFVSIMVLIAFAAGILSVYEHFYPIIHSGDDEVWHPDNLGLHAA